MGRLFEHFEDVDLPAAREKAKKEGREEGRKEGREEGLAEGDQLRLIRMISRKMKRSKSVETIAEELEEDLSVVEKICIAAAEFAPEYDEKKIHNKLKTKFQEEDAG